MTDAFRPRRCMLLTPGSDLRMIDKARQSDADMLLLDLDDAVVYEDAAKVGAQQAMHRAVSTLDFTGKEVVVRINSIDTPWWQEDLRFCVEAGVRTVMPTKANNPEDLMAVVRHLDGLPGGDTVRLWPMIETTGAIVNCELIASQVPRLAGMCFGIGDYTVSVGAQFIDTPDRVSYPLGKMVCVARYHGLTPLAPAVAFTNFKSDAVIAEWGNYLRRVGYAGALVIHPRHVGIINEIFSPSREEIDSALEMRDAIAEARSGNRAAVVIGGKLIEKVNIDIAKRTLAIAERLGLVDSEVM